MSLFNYTTGNPTNLTGGAGASMTDIQGPLVDLRTFLNGGNIDATNLAGQAVTAAKVASWPRAKAIHNATQAIGTGTTTVALNSELFDTDTMHDTVTNNSRLTCKTAGTYMVGGNIEFAGSATGAFRNLLIVVNNTASIAADSKPPAGANPTRLMAVTVLSLAVSDFVELQVNQDTGGSLNLTGQVGTNQYTPVLWATWMGP